MGLLLLILLILFLVGAMPRWNYSRDWGYRPSGVAAALLVLLCVLLLLDVVRWGF
jgi:hypothetical protein